MKRMLVSLLIAGTLVAATPVYAGGQRESATTQTLTIGATTVPHAVLLNLIRDELAEKQITLRVVEYSDYVTPNTALMAGDLDANFFQHIPYLESNEEWNTRLVSAFGVHIEPFGLYSQKYTSLAALPMGATIAIPNDPSNGGRALLLLQANGLLTLREDAGITATVLDIVDNPKNFSFRELEAAQLPRALPDVDAATINGNYALQAGFNPVRDSLIIEGAESPYVNIVVVRRGTENDSRIKALEAALCSERVREYIENIWTNGSVVPVF